MQKPPYNALGTEKLIRAPLAITAILCIVGFLALPTSYTFFVLTMCVFGAGFASWLCRYDAIVLPETMYLMSLKAHEVNNVVASKSDIEVNDAHFLHTGMCCSRTMVHQRCVQYPAQFEKALKVNSLLLLDSCSITMIVKCSRLFEGPVQCNLSDSNGGSFCHSYLVLVSVRLCMI
jgi:hypothetical protein